MPAVAALIPEWPFLGTFHCFEYSEHDQREDIECLGLRRLAAKICYIRTFTHFSFFPCTLIATLFDFALFIVPHL